MYQITNFCNGCGACLTVCPVDGAIIEDETFSIHPDLCAECGACVDECERDAIEEA